MYSRTERVIGKENVEILKKSNISVLGVGGVGGYVVEMLARLGVGNITIIDFDVVDKSNINRQIVALNSTIGKNKVDVMKARILDINPLCNIIAINKKIEADSLKELLSKNFDYVIDAIDDLNAKLEVVKYCKNNNLNLVSSMGTGNRSGIPNFEVSDISKTSYDKLAKKFRKMLKDENINSLDVVYTKEPVETTEALGSIVYYPVVCAANLVSFVINKLIKK